ncbi:ammonium transporter [Phaeodactylibacter luteus]|uniref:Ammonium transporter n=1 Tax=Phaeodactylibacter luteus TaxID=1564516 RepID=A0A5C6RWS2_9BACT|nr:ammonium transporter [Phaeodactylibacter luteus]TXB66527.1 ammonium transporter [Phaeodactylibacter luteus]
MNEALFTANNVWMLVSTVLVFVMHLGFSTLEAGFVQRKNTVNILFKNAMIISIGLLTYCVVGFNLMYPGVNEGGFFGFAGFGLAMPEGAAGAIAYADGNYTYWTDFIFQGMFAATAATIVSGAVAERIKLNAFLIFATLFVAISYPITGMWKWGAGWLDAAGFYDFAGSTLVHAVGGWGALASVLLLGARKGKYTKDGIKPIPGHSMPLAAIGVFLLWFGWFGFNGGSVLSADPVAVSLVFVTTSLAASAGAVAAFFVSYALFKSHDLSMVLNGILGGLVGITAGADLMSPTDAILIGAIAGAVIPVSVVFFDRIKIDDPVGATSVHLVCGIWGTLAVGIFGAKAGLGQLWTQLYGTLSVGVFTFVFAFGLMYVLKATIGIRVSEEEEERGLDVAEHDMEAYEAGTVTEPGYQMVK